GRGGSAARRRRRNRRLGLEFAPGSERSNRMATDTIVEVDNVHFSFPGRDIFNGISAAIPRGRIVGIMGASGSGKTTLLRLIGGQLLPQQGSIRIDGEAINALDRDDLYRVRRKIGM